MLEVGWWGVIKGSFQKHLKTLREWIKTKVVCRGGGGGVEGVTTPPPPKILIVHLTLEIICNVQVFP